MTQTIALIYLFLLTCSYTRRNRSCRLEIREPQLRHSVRICDALGALFRFECLATIEQSALSVSYLCRNVRLEIPSPSRHHQFRVFLRVPKLMRQI